MLRVQILSGSNPRLLRRSNIATLLASMHRVASTSRLLRSFMASGAHRWWPSALARRVSPRFAAANPPICHVSRFPGSGNVARSSGLKGEELGKPDRRPVSPSAKDFIISLGKLSASTQSMKEVENTDTAKQLITHHSYVPPANSAEDDRRAIRNVFSGDKDAFKTTLEVIDNKPDITGEIVDTTGCELSSESDDEEIPHDPMYEFILPYSSHRDGSIYRGTQPWKRSYSIHDRNETRIESTMFSDPIGCMISRDGTCMSHTTCNMLQVFSLRLVKIPMEYSSVELYGYIAARDNLDTLLNYVVNISKDDPIIVKQGSVINMAGPKRGIKLIDTTIIEYDMRIKIGQHEEEDLQLIDGVSIIDEDTWDCSPFTWHINGGCGVIDLAASRLNHAVQATIEVFISQVQGSFRMQLGCFTSGLREEIRLFDGAIGESRGLKRSVVAVKMKAHMELKLKVARDSRFPAEYCCSFKANKHGRVTEEVKTDFALIAVKVTWSALMHAARMGALKAD
ncbi:hypothetical protein BS78_03G239800 [Paspalum vaginatum]|nr:hypothetical protein BS78_03G239800 [Paspalum vaginatum]KAJ1284892.1 hypothetical protein BS78_03G239800 [Paspalum vaginatum]